MEKVKSVLFNPKKLGNDYADQKTKEIFEKTVNFFENKGLKRLVEEDKACIWLGDWVKYAEENGIYSTLMTKQGYGEEARFDFSRICDFLETVSFYSPAHFYATQVTFLGVFPIWMSENERQKEELAQQLKDGNLFAFGLTEKAIGADIYSTATKITPVGDGKYLVNGEKYYIGNAHIAPKIPILAKNTETGDWMSFVADSRHDNFKYIKDVEVRNIFGSAKVGNFSLVEYPITEDDILEEGDEAFTNALLTINMGKYLVGVSALGFATHSFYEAITHSNRRILYGNKVTDMPHVQSFYNEAFARLNAMRLFSYRALDYSRAMTEGDRRYMLYNSLSKSKTTLEADRVQNLLFDATCAKAYEEENYLSRAQGIITAAARLEGTVHTNMSLIFKLMKSYFSTDAGFPEVEHGRYAKDDSNMFDQSFGGLAKIQFNRYDAAYEGVDLPNVKVFKEQIEIFKEMMMKAPVEKELMTNMEYMLNLGQIFSQIAYAQLVLENAKLENVHDDLIDRMFSLFVNDINNYALAQLNTQNNTGEQEKYLEKLILTKAVINKKDDDTFFKTFVEIQDGAYIMNDAAIGMD